MFLVKVHSKRIIIGQSNWQKYDETTIGGVQLHLYRKPKKVRRHQKQT